MKPFADYEFYKNEFKGTALTEEEFNASILEASAYINKITYQRLKEDNAEITEEVKLATCAVAEIVYQQKGQEACYPQAAVSSENVDGYSVSYVSAESRLAGFESEKKNAASLYLPLSDPLRYAGV